MGRGLQGGGRMATGADFAVGYLLTKIQNSSILILYSRGRASSLYESSKSEFVVSSEQPRGGVPML